jgi:probable phosphoglycerate mutase
VAIARAAANRIALTTRARANVPALHDPRRSCRNPGIRPEGGRELTRIALLRHFSTAWNQDDRLQGRQDIPLNDAARKSLRRLAIPEPWRSARLIASPLVRAVETARILARGQPIAYDPRLVEMNYGEWEGKRRRELLADPESGYVHIEQWGWHLRPPGGESPRDVWERVRPLLAEIASDASPALLIVHRALARVILARAWGWNYDSPKPFEIERERIYPLTLLPDGTPTAPEEPARLISYR